MIKALVVDDEVIVAEDLAFQLNSREGWSAEFCSDPLKVEGELGGGNFDVCFLDIEMPEKNGISLARSIKETFPEVRVVFATAFAEHAATAYRLPATDYLVKPINSGALNEACQRVEADIEVSNAANAVSDVSPPSRVIVVKSVGRTDYVKISDILMGQAAGNYVRLYCEDKEYLHRCPFTDFVDKMEQEGFVRCHRSFVVNASKVKSFVRSKESGDELILGPNTKAPVSQAFRKSIDNMLAQAGNSLV